MQYLEVARTVSGAGMSVQSKGEAVLHSHRHNITRAIRN